MRATMISKRPGPSRPVSWRPSGRTGRAPKRFPPSRFHDGRIGGTGPFRQGGEILRGRALQARREHDAGDRLFGLYEEGLRRLQHRPAANGKGTAPGAESASGATVWTRGISCFSRRGEIASTWGSFWAGADSSISRLETGQGRSTHGFDLFQHPLHQRIRLKETDRPAKLLKPGRTGCTPYKHRPACHPRPRWLTRRKANPPLQQSSIKTPRFFQKKSGRFQPHLKPLPEQERHQSPSPQILSGQRKESAHLLSPLPSREREPMR